MRLAWWVNGATLGVSVGFIFAAYVTDRDVPWSLLAYWGVNFTALVLMS